MRMCKLLVFLLFLQHRKIRVYAPLPAASLEKERRSVLSLLFCAREQLNGHIQVYLEIFTRVAVCCLI